MAHNPYQPPQSLGTSRKLLRHGASSPATLIAYLIAAIAYNGFIIVLLNSNPGDRFAGCLFAINTPTMMAWGFIIWRDSRHWLIGGVVVSIVQCMITAGMLIFGVGLREPILVVLGIALSAYAVVLLVCWWNARRTVDANEAEL